MKLTYNQMSDVFGGLNSLDAHLNSLIANKERRPLLKDTEVNGLFCIIAKNLRHLKTKLEGLNEDKENIRLKLSEQDPSGKPMQFKTTVKDEAGNSQEVFQAKITDPTNAQIFAAQMQVFYKAEHEIDIHAIDYDKIKKLEVSGSTLALLMDTVIAMPGEKKEE